jgi:diguanylate cyclase (GGDEF)-like protein
MSVEMSLPPKPETLESLELPDLASASPRLPDLARSVTTLLAGRLGVPAALLSRTEGVWRFEAEAWPAEAAGARVDPPWRAAEGRVDDVAAGEFGADEPTWTAIAVGEGEDGARSWILLLPGAPELWEGTSVVREFVPDIGALLEDAAEREDSNGWKRTARRYHRFCRRLLRTQTADELYALILRGMAAQVRAEVGALAVYSESTQRLSIVKTLGYPHELVDHLRIAPGEGVIGSVFASGRPALADDVVLDRPRRLRYRTDSFAAVPLVGHGGVLGVVAFTDRRDGSAFTQDDLATLRLLADPASLALTSQNLRLAADEVTRLASIDPLTGLFNRRYFDTRLEAELQRARRNGEPLTLLMVDIDNFKRINDDHGHMVGDRLLRCVADRLRRGVRIFDVCARYGGDEFAILMPSSNVDTAVLVADRIRASVGGHCAHGTAGVTVSIGVAHSDGRESELLSIADRALLEAKALGKNMVRVQRIPGDQPGE